MEPSFCTPHEHTAKGRSGTAPFVTYVLYLQQGHNFCIEDLLPPSANKAAQMISFVRIHFHGSCDCPGSIRILLKTGAGQPKRAEKEEKAEIIKQLVALSEREKSPSAIASTPTTSLRLASSSAIRSDTLRKRTQRELNSKAGGSPVSPNSPVQLRPNVTRAEIDEQIRLRAYQLYQERGGVGGDPTSDWLQAKEDVLSAKAKAATT